MILRRSVFLLCVCKSICMISCFIIYIVVVFVAIVVCQSRETDLRVRTYYILSFSRTQYTNIYTYCLVVKICVPYIYVTFDVLLKITESFVDFNDFEATIPTTP